MHKKNCFRLLPSFFSVGLFGLSFWTIHQYFHHYNVQNFEQSLSAVSLSNFLGAIALTSLNYLIMTGYDYLGLMYVGHTLPYPKTAFVAFICSGISQNVGFPVLSSGMIRYRFYSTWGLSLVDIAQVSAFCDLSFCLGLFAVGAIIFLNEPLEVPNLLHLPFNSVRPLGELFIVIVFSYLFLTLIRQKPLKLGKWKLPLISFRLAVSQLVVATLDWLLAAAVFYAILSHSIPLSYSAFLAIFMLARMAELVSNVPGGVGIFEVVILVSLSQFIASKELFGFLLIYRGIYYFIPLILSGLLFGRHEVKQVLKKK
ncbi:lysylphosphatidylglycerol synthase domain-containing protein [Crocosphaera sp. Alani8]|uniref:lysylphosphatidylglycerol synthase domain-containing protein n=1 Tax=Crocosphaera sp. Alani8 TaxID=3038952 RepID=UPI00313AEB23